MGSPAVTDRATWQARIDDLRVREKAHTREGDAIAAARRRLPMVEIDAAAPLIGAEGPVSLAEIFAGRSQLLVYVHMWHAGRPASEQCEGCTFNTSHVTELGYLHSRDVTFAVLFDGPYEEGARYREFMGYPAPWYALTPEALAPLAVEPDSGYLVSYLREADRVFETYRSYARGNEPMASSYGLLDMTVYGRQESWEDSPEGWPQHWGSDGGQFIRDGRPAAQWSRVAAGRNDDLGGS